MNAKTEQRLEVPARLDLFGFAPSEADVRLAEWQRPQRLMRALAALAITLVLAPIVAIIPPHVPWPIAALAVGAVVARRRWRAVYTIEAFAGKCPKCGADVPLSTPAALKPEHPVTCMQCHSELTLEVDVPDAGADRG